MASNTSTAALLGELSLSEFGLGCLAIQVGVTTLMFGATTVQVYTYACSCYNDNIWMRLMVSWILTYVLW
jgi:hypothetical protein